LRLSTFSQQQSSQYSITKLLEHSLFCRLISTMKKLYSEIIFDIFSIKRNIKKKYDLDRVDENISKYKNLSEIDRIVNLIEKKKKKIMKMISQWFNANSNNKILYLKINNEIIRITFFIKLINEKYQNYFENKFVNFINETTRYFIQRCFKRDRRRKIIEDQDFFSIAFSSQKRAFDSMISQSNSVENIKLQANLKKINFINFCTVKNIMIDIMFNNANINII
jgi:hypothetical protein